MRAVLLFLGKQVSCMYKIPNQEHYIIMECIYSIVQFMSHDIYLEMSCHYSQVSNLLSRLISSALGFPFRCEGMSAPTNCPFHVD